MNILIFSTIYPAPDKYSIPNDTKVVHYYAKQWKNAGHAVQVVYLHMIPVKKILDFKNAKKINGFVDNYKWDGICVHLIEYQLLIPRTNTLAAWQAKNAKWRIEHFLNKVFVPDKVFVHFPCTFRGVTCLTGFQCPTMAVLHNIDLYLLQKKSNLTTELNRYRNIGGRNNHICDTVSAYLSRKCVPVFSGIDEALVPKLEWIEKKLEHHTNRIKIVYAGNLIQLKNVDVIIKALQCVSFEYQCEIIGDGPEKKRLEAMAHGCSDIVFKGKMSRKATIEKMREADVFVMVSSPETFGLVYIEAMAQGCITVGSKNEGIDGILRNGENGFLVEPGDIDKLKDCLNDIFLMSQERKNAIVFSAYCKATEMTDQNMAKLYLQLNQ